MDTANRSPPMARAERAKPAFEGPFAGLITARYPLAPITGALGPTGYAAGHKDEARFNTFSEADGQKFLSGPYGGRFLKPYQI